MVQAQIKIDELELLIEHQGLKNLDSFAVRGRIARIKKDFEALLQTDAIAAYHNLGILYAHQSDYTRANLYFKKTLALSPNDVITLLNYPKVLEMLGQYQDALEISKKALEIEPFNSIAFQRLNQLSDLYLFPEYVNLSYDLYKGQPIEEKYARTVEGCTSIIEFLNQINLNLDTYRSHLNLALKLFRDMFNIHNLHRSIDKNYEGKYLSTVIYIPNVSAEIVASLNEKLDEKINMWLTSQPDGGFNLADELEGSIIYFSAEVQN